MGADLYNLGAVMRDLAPALLGVAPGDGGGRWVGRQFPAGEPVVEVVGGRATGKTTLLDALHASYHVQLPTARVDLAEDHECRDGITASPVTDLLFKVTYELAKERGRGHGGRALTFPRLWPALAVITAWSPETSRTGVVPPPGLTAAENEVRDIVAERNPDPQHRKVALQRWLNAVGGILGALLPQVPGLAGVLQASTETFFADSHRTAQGTWWVTRMTDEDGDAVQRLFALIRQFRRGGGSRKAAEAHLLAALLADVDASYGRWARQTRHPPLLLVDNVDTVLRGRLLEPLVAQYAEYRNERGSKAVLPVVFTTSLGNGSARGLVPVNAGTSWTAPDRCPPQVWLLRLGIPPVGEDEICRMLKDVDQPSALSTVIARLSGGRAGSALALAEAALTEARRSGASPALDRLLKLPCSDPSETVAERLLAQWLPDPAVRREALAVAPALDETAAATLLRATGDEGATNPALLVRELVDHTLHRDLWNDDSWVRAHCWPVAGASPLVADRALRTVLLHRLALPDSQPSWAQTHARLAEHYNPGNVRSSDSVRHDPPYLHHALGLGRFDSLVVPAMHHRYLHCAPADWLRTLNLLAAGPPPPSGFPVDQSAETDGLPPCPACEEGAGGRRAHSAIRQLLVTVWRLSSPLSGSPTGYGDRDVVQVKLALGSLCAGYEDHPEAGAAYNAYVDALADRGWIDALVSGAQAPHLPVVERQVT